MNLTFGRDKKEKSGLSLLLLVSLTLFVAMLTNLVLLPSLLLSLEKRILTQNFKESEDLFQDDQDIEWNKL